MLPAQKLAQHLLRLPAASLRVDRLQNRDDVIQQERGVVSASVAAAATSATATATAVAVAVAVGVSVSVSVSRGGGVAGRVAGRRGGGVGGVGFSGVKKGKDPQLATDPVPRAGNEVRIAREQRRRQGLVPREPVRAHVQRVQAVSVDVAAAGEGGVCVCVGRGAGGGAGGGLVGPSGPVVDGSVRVGCGAGGGVGVWASGWGG